MAVATYYFDGSDGTTTGSSWSGLTNVTDGSTSTAAVTSAYNTSDLVVFGTNAPSSGGAISSVRARAYGMHYTGFDDYLEIYTQSRGETLLGYLASGPTTDSNTTPAWTSWFSVTAPSGGWSWSVLQVLEAAMIYDAGPPGTKEGDIYRIEIEVTYTAGTVTSSERGLYIGGLPFDIYTRENGAILDTNDTDLGISFTAQDYTDIATDDNIYLDLSGVSTYNKFLFKDYNTNNLGTDDIIVTWSGKSTLAPSDSTAYLQIYNRTSSSWETLDSDGTTAANTEFILSGTQSTSLSDYYDANYVTSCRIYQ